MPARMEHDGWRVVPLEFPDATYGVAVDALASLAGLPVAIVPADQLPPVDAAIIAVLQPGDDADAALDAGRERLDRLAAALGFRQMGQGRKLVYVAWGHGEVVTSMPYQHRAMITHQLDDTDDIRELHSFAARLSNARSAALVRLYLDALRDPSIDGSLARLWSLLETLGEHFGGGKKKKVVDAVRHVGVGYGTDFDHVYRLRNLFVHEGRTGDPDVVGTLRDETAFTAWTVLLNSGFAPVDPSSPRRQPHELSTREAILRRHRDAPEEDRG